MDATADRDAVAELLAAAGIAMVHASRLAEDVALWAGRGWVRLPTPGRPAPACSPRNAIPTWPSWSGAGPARSWGGWPGSWPPSRATLAYARDLQEDKAAAFEAADIVRVHGRWPAWSPAWN